MNLPANAALIVIDVQHGFDDPKWGERNNPDCEDSIRDLVAAWRSSDRPVYWVRHDSLEADSPLRPGQQGNDLKLPVLPGEAVIGKTVNSAFIGTDLERSLRERGIGTLVLVGLTTDHCVSTTARMAGNLGFAAFVPADAVATFAKTSFDGRRWSAEDLHDASLAQLHGEFCTVLTAAQLLEMGRLPA